MADRTQATEASIKEYGLQTLKWLFLLNAGAIALVLKRIPVILKHSLHA